MKRFLSLSFLLGMGMLANLAASLHAEEVQWNLESWKQAPARHAVATDEAGVEAFFFDALPWKGKPTRLFAFYGKPSTPPPASGRYPAVILLHGGTGTAYADWVRLWNAHGYAAIALDHMGTMPTSPAGTRPYASARSRHPHSGPDGDGGFHQIDLPMEDQWTWHGVAATVLAHSLLASFPEVDEHQIGLTGISWGGYLAAIVAGVDERFRFVMPVYGCGYLGEEGSWPPALLALDEEKANRWRTWWDPSRYLAKARMPLLWINGTNDIAFSLQSWHRSTLLPTNPANRLLIIPGLTHGHPQGANLDELFAFADQATTGRQRLPQPGIVTVRGTEATLTFPAPQTLREATLWSTRDQGEWQKRTWENAPVPLHPRTLKANLPQGTTAFYFLLTNREGLRISTPLHLLP